jgi:hypothetical protein
MSEFTAPQPIPQPSNFRQAAPPRQQVFIPDEEKGEASLHGQDLDHLDDSVDVFMNDRGVAEDVPLTGGRQRVRPGCWGYCCLAFMAAIFVIGVTFPLLSFIYTTYRLIWDSDFYTFEQYAVIYMTCLKLGLYSIFLLSTSRNSCIQFLSSISIFLHLAVWDFAHRGGFFSIPSATRDLHFRVSNFIFFAFIIGYIITAILFFLMVLLMIGLFCWDRRRRQQILAANRVVLNNLGKMTRQEWTAKHTPEQIERERARSLDNCCICYSPIGDESFLAEIPVCNHIFHHSCVMEWLQKNPTCPICRENVVKNIQAAGQRA